MPRRHEDVVSQLIGDLAASRYRAGERLPSEQALADRLGTSRSTIREAVRTLEGKGMLEVRAGKGQVARPDDRWTLGQGDVLLAVLESERDPGFVREAVDARMIMESTAAEQTSQHATEGDLLLLRDRVQEMERAAAATAGRSAWVDDAFVQAEADFHHALLLIGGNRVLASVAEPMHLVLATVRLRRAPDRESAVIGQHRRILEGVSSGDPMFAVSTVEAYARRLLRWLATRS